MMIQVSPMAPIVNAVKIPESITSPTPVATIARVVEKHEPIKPAIVMWIRLNVVLDSRRGFGSAIDSRVSDALTFRDDSKSTSTAAAATDIDRLTSCRSEIDGSTWAMGEV
ncbi:MAG: hypothetical protein NTAFB01_38570 [Nitrospira sp.]